MSESIFPQDSSQAPSWDDAVPPDEGPQFGALDIVEAFTAMRHEWRGQTKESRELSAQIGAAVAAFQSLEAKILTSVAKSRADDAAKAKPLALLLVETEHQLSRAVSAITEWETNRRLREQGATQAIVQRFDQMSWLARRLARPLLAFIIERKAPPNQAPTTRRSKA